MTQKRWTIAQLKALVFKLLDESNPKNDLTQKIPVFMNAAQKEVSLYCPIEAVLPVTEDTMLPSDCRRVTRVTDLRTETAEAFRLVMTESGKAVRADSYPALVWYEKIPEEISETTPADTELELPEKAVLAMAYYIAAECNSLEYDQRFFQSFFAQYQGKLQNLAGEANGADFVVTAESDLPDWM